MPNLTTKVLTAIEDQLSIEKTMVTKYQQYAMSCSDQQLKTKCEQIAAKHQSHYTRLLNQLG